MNKRIVVDFDSTLVDSKSAIVSIYNRIYGESIDPITCNTWEFSELPLASQDEITEWFNCKEFYEVVKRIDGMFELIRDLFDDGNEIIICSYSHKNGMKNKLEYIQKNLPFVDCILLEIGADDSKLDKSNCHGDIIIDDNLYAIESSPCKHKIVFGDYSWNKTDKYIKAKNSIELREEIYKIIKGE